MNPCGPVLVLLPLDDAQSARLEAAAPRRVFRYSTFDTVTAEQVCDAEIIIGNIPIHLLAHCAALKWYQLQSAGADAIIRSGMLGKEVLLTNAGGAYDRPQAEFMLGALLATMKKLPQYWQNQQQHIWRDEGPERLLSESTVVLVGMGRIGNRLAELLRAFGAYTIGVTRTGNPTLCVADEIYSVHMLNSQLERADIVVLTLPLTDKTAGMFNAMRFSYIRRGALFLNAGRGGTVDTEALYDALKSGRLTYAVIDVLEEEPLNPRNELWDLPNIMITPHVAGRDFLPSTLEKTLEISMANLAGYERGEILKNIIDRSLAY